VKGLAMPDHLPAGLARRQDDQGRSATVGAVVRRTLRFGVLLGLLAGIAVAIAKLLDHDEPVPLSLASQPPEPWPPLLSDPAVPAAATERAIRDPEAPAPPTPAPVERVWIEPRGNVCPTTHPVKAKMTSKIFHLPGMANYDRTNPDRCYVDAAAAEADGLRLSKR
jgi:hypothetical protein